MGDQIIIVNEEANLLDEAKSIIESIALDCGQQNGSFNIGLSGGSLVDFLEKSLPKIKARWDSWNFFFCDERIVSFDDSDSTYGLYRDRLIGKLPLSESQFFKVNPELPASEAAADYENKLRTHFGNNLPQFDLLLLGLGPDGHTCSLFPSHPVVSEEKLWVAPVTDSPKPPPSRITLTLPVINNAKNVMFIAFGKGKADIIKKIFADKEDLPASRVKPTSGKLYWVMDKAAALHMPSDVINTSRPR